MVMDLYSKSTHSLKEKRNIVTSIKGKLKQRFNISIIESDYQDRWQKIQLAISMVSNSRVMIEKVFNQIEDLIYLNFPVQLVTVDKEYL
jgi:uncharacterized protein YlxP (DUF503 family)